MKPDEADEAHDASADASTEHGAKHLQSQFRAAREDFEQRVEHARENFGEANERIKQRTGRDLILAIGIGVAIGAVLLVSLLFVKEAFILVAFVGGIGGTFELARAMVHGGRRVDTIVQVVVAFVIIGSAYLVELWLLWVLFLVGVVFLVVWRALAQMTARDGRTYRDVIDDVLVTGFIPLYLSLPAALSLVLLRQDHGQMWVLMFIAVAVSADTGAYIAGVWVGKHPMVPRVSPKKTWEGFAGGVLLALVVATVLCIFLLQLPWWTGIIAGVAILITATVGDLGESLIKRDLGIKDMSSWLPGHGGILDRLDSVLPSAVAGLALFTFLSPLAAS